MFKAAAFAVEDEMYGQDVGVAVRVVEGEELMRWVRVKVAAFKVPKRVGEFFTSYVAGFKGHLCKRRC